MKIIMRKNRKMRILLCFLFENKKKSKILTFLFFLIIIFKKTFLHFFLKFLCTFTFRVSRRGCVIEFITILWMRNKDFKGELFVYTILGRIISFYEIVNDIIQIKVQFSIYIYTSHKLYLLDRSFIITLKIMKTLMRSYFSLLK